MMLVNGKPAPHIPADDRGLAYGDGVFRTLRAVAGRPLQWGRHYAKLHHDCGALDLSCPPESVLLADVQRVAVGHALATVKIIVTRGGGPRGYAPPRGGVPSRIVMAEASAPPARHANGVTVRLCRLRLSHQPALAGVKHLNRLENVLARAEWNDSATAEGLLLDQEGFAIGGTMSNLFIIEDGALITPDLSRSGVAGVTRDRIIDLAKQAGTGCRVEALPYPRVRNAEGAFLVNSLIGLWPIASLEGRTWVPTTLARDFAHALETDDAARD